MKTGSPYLLSSPLGKSESSSQRETWTKMSANCHSYWLQLSESVKPHWCYAANSFIAFWCIGCVQSVFCHKKAQNAVRATRCHWLFQSSMAACSGRPDNKKGNGRSSAMQKQHHSWPGRMACGRRSQILGRICEDRCAPGTASWNLQKGSNPKMMAATNMPKTTLQTLRSASEVFNALNSR